MVVKLGGRIGELVELDFGFGQPQQYTTGLPPMGPSNQPFITPILFILAQSTIPSFPLGP